MPADWQANIVSGRAYDLRTDPGAKLWRECLDRAQSRPLEWVQESLERERLGKPQVILPRLGQGAFRIAVLDAYGGACAVTTEHSMPVLEAAHIRPWGLGGAHDVPNGIPLRRDLHRLFDLGYVTIRPDLRLAVSGALRDEYENGRTSSSLTVAGSRYQARRSTIRIAICSSGTARRCTAADGRHSPFTRRGSPLHADRQGPGARPSPPAGTTR